MADVEVREDGAQVTVNTGDRVVIRVEENATTGYQWSLVGEPAPLQLETSELVPAADLAPGAAGERRVVLRARGGGRATVVLELRRAWEAGAPPARSFGVEVTVA